MDQNSIETNEAVSEAFEEIKEPKKQNKKLSLTKKIGIIVLALVVLVGGGVYFYVAHILGNIERIDKDNEYQMTQEEAEAWLKDNEEDEDPEIPEDPEEPEETEPDLNNADIKLVTDPNVTNILLIGVDTRNASYSGRSDSMMICSINKNTNKITLVSILRDLYVEIEGYKNNKLNAAYAFGGVSLLNKTIEKNLGVHIDYNIVINFSGFEKVMSKVGSLEITLTEAEVEYLKSKHPGWDIKAGVNTLSSSQLLVYSRMRHLQGADWGRTDRQRRLIYAIFNKYRSKGITAVLDLINQVTPYIKTDMTNSQIVSQARTVISSGMNIGKTISVPTGNMYRSMYVRGRAVLVPDMAAVSKTIHQALYGVD